ncbi:helix-turn-helix domain-containing protein, partial [Pseudonocardia acaciae]
MARKQAMMRFLDAMLVAEVKIDNVAEWCRANGVNPRTFYRHRARVAAEGEWRERSRRPRSSPTATSGVVVAEVLRLREVLA